MKMSMSFKNVRHSSRLEETVTEKTERLDKFFEGQTVVSWIFSKGDRGTMVDMKISGPSFQYHAQSKTENLYQAIDETISKIERQVKKKKEKVKNRIHRGKGAKQIPLFREKETWETELEMYNESLDKAA